MYAKMEYYLDEENHKNYLSNENKSL